MSLTRRLKDKEIAQQIKPLIRNPGFSKQKQVVESTGASGQRVGTAFDYLVRFGLAHRFPTEERHTVAELGAGTGEHLGMSTGEVVDNMELVHEALEATREGTAGPNVDDETARAVLTLAAFTTFWRSGRPEAIEAEPTADEIDELRRLFDLIPWSEFEPKNRLFLNPVFGEGSLLVSGADADLVVDDMVVEVKTVKTPKFLETTRQAVCYALLANRFGLNQEEEPAGIARIGAYLSRSGTLLTADLDDCIDPEQHGEVLDILLKESDG